MDLEPSSSKASFQPGDLIWAKMKGFPPWPAKVLEKGEDTPARRIPVMFFGTLETSFMKPNDLSDYLTHRNIHEIARKQKDFNKAVQEIRKAAGLSSEQDDTAFPVAAKSPPSSPTPGRTRQNSERFLNVIMSSGVDATNNGKRKRSNSASTKSRSRASSNASAFKTFKDLIKKDRRRLDSESSHGSKRKMISGGISEMFDSQYADSTDFNALFGDVLLGDLATMPEENKSWKSKRSRGSSRIIDDLLFNRSRKGSGSGRRSRIISMSGFSGVSDMFDDLFSGNLDIDAHAEQLMHTLHAMPSDGSVDRPLSPELLAPALPGPMEFCQSCGFECRLINGVWRCNSTHCISYKEAAAPTESKLEIPLSLNIKTESVSSGEKLINSMLMAQPGSSKEMPEMSIKQEIKSPQKTKRGNLIIKQEEEESADDIGSRREKKKRRVQVMSPRSPGLPHPTQNLNDITTSSSNGQPSTSGTNNGASSSSTTRGDNNNGSLTGGRLSPSPRRDRTRPKHYGYSKVEKTPPISASGHRHCVNCNGQVRPQMCGGNRHRWRCVDKKCRKWYGWVRSHEEIPKNVGRKKVNVKSASSTSAQKPSSSSSAKLKKKEEEEDPYPILKRKVGRPSKNDIKIRLKLQKEAAVALAARPTPAQQQQQQQQTEGTNPLQRRKYTKRKNKDGTPTAAAIGGGGGVKREYSPFDEEAKKRAVSPLPDQMANYRPCAMEKRARWWTGEKRRVDASPERELGTTAADTAAAFRMMANAVRSAAVTRADEVGTVNGSLDLLMDTLIGSMAPLLSLLQKVPVYKIDEKLPQQLWNSSAVHIPTFQ